MRQAGRYQKEYRDLRARLSFIELCKSPELATEVTLLPVTQLGVDAAIIFADILLILEPLGVGFEFEETGPKIRSPLRTARQVEDLESTINAAESLGYVMQALRLTRAALPPHVALIGFAGAPFTLASYLIEGGGTKDYLRTKSFMYADEGLWNVLMTKIVDALQAYVNAQIDAGAQAIQIFDSWVGCLSCADYQHYVKHHMQRLISRINPSVPLIHFGTGNPMLYTSMADAGGTVLGVDWRVDIGEIWPAMGDVAIMGNLDPAYLLAPRNVLLGQAERVLKSAAGRPGHIFNLGHGVMPEAQVDQVRALVDHVHEVSARLNTTQALPALL